MALRDWIERLEQRYPVLRQWLGERLDLQLPALGVSLFSHVALLVSLGMLSYAAAHQEPPAAFRTEVVDTRLSDFAKLEDSTAVAELDQTDIQPVAGSFGPEATALLASTYDPNGRGTTVQIAPPVEVEPAPEMAPDAVKLAGLSLPKPTQLDSTVAIRGNGAEHVENVEGAVDRIAVELLRRLEQGPTLVVWAFDASGSLQAEREKLAGTIETIYQHIRDLDRDGLSSGEGLLTAVVGFGQDRRVITDEPTSDPAAIAQAIRKVPLDTTGIESTFRTVGEIARKFGKYKRDGQGYRPLTVVVTDEVGDDEELLEGAIQAANAVKMPVYVLGSAALFGRTEGYMDYTDPVTKQTFQNLPVRQGPESALAEGIRLPFWYDGPQHDLLDAGFGPYALSRLAGGTGGVYFITRMGGHRVTFDPVGMREYKPDWISRDQYEAMIARNPLRQAVVRAGLIAQENLPGQPSMTFPPVDAPNFKDEMTRNQEAVARVQYTVDEALGVAHTGPGGEPTIAAVAGLRDREPSRRWQAHYDLIRGRLMAMKIRCMEYNLACARMKKDPPKFSKPTSNAWRLVPDTEIHLPGKAADAAAEARTLLERVVQDHPGTPWALLARRELQHPLGLKWVEVTLPPPPKPVEGDGNAGNNNPNRTMPAKPPEPPKL